MKRSFWGVPIAVIVFSWACSSPPPHADHRPRHGGLVLMYGDLHFEVILNTQGRHRVYFTDAVRAELPPSIASEVTMTITDSGGAAETLKAQIDVTCKCWVASGRPVDDVGATARVAFVAQGKSYWIDIPFGFGG